MILKVWKSNTSKKDRSGRRQIPGGRSCVEGDQGFQAVAFVQASRGFVDVARGARCLEDGRCFLDGGDGGRMFGSAARRTQCGDAAVMFGSAMRRDGGRMFGSAARWWLCKGTTGRCLWRNACDD